MSEIFKTSRKDQVFEKFIKEMKPLTRKSLRRDFRVVTTKAGKERHILRFDYDDGFEVNCELKEKK